MLQLGRTALNITIHALPKVPKPCISSCKIMNKWIINGSSTTMFLSRRFCLTHTRSHLKRATVQCHLQRVKNWSWCNIYISGLDFPIYAHTEEGGLCHLYWMEPAGANKSQWCDMKLYILSLLLVPRTNKTVCFLSFHLVAFTV